ncbi:MAG: glutaredoxin, partial [Chlamydiae bacterium]|nr:glutaredoxin [Chlamydiota bacterium]
NVSLKNISSDPIAKEELFHIGGKVQVPCLFIDGTPLYESQYIIDWLKEDSKEK